MNEFTGSRPAMSKLPGVLTRDATLYAALALLSVSAIIELGLISATVSWVHRVGGGSFTLTSLSTTPATFTLHGKPAGLLADHGHTANGAAGTALILVSLWGAIALALCKHQQKHEHNQGTSPAMRAFTRVWLQVWRVWATLSTLLTLAALVYTFVLTRRYAGQRIDVSVAAGLGNAEYPDYVAYPEGFWTPENWFVAVLALGEGVLQEGARGEVRGMLKIDRGWRWNLVPLFVLGVWVG